MRKIHLIFIYLILFFLWAFLSIHAIIPDGYRFYVFIFWLFSFMSILNTEYFTSQPNGFANWVNPIIKLSILFIRLDEVEKMSETKRIVKYLNEYFDPVTVRYKIKYYKKESKKEQNLNQLCKEIREVSGSIEKIRVVQHLIRLALADKLLTEVERKFISEVAKKLAVPKHTLNALFAMHTFVTEEDIKNQQTAKSTVNYGLQRAYSLLGLDSTASFEEVKSAYRELAKIYHPDKQKGSKKSSELAKNQFQAISTAYNLIKDSVN